MPAFDRVFPFSAIVGQEKLKQALILNAVNPGVGGVLIRGEKGTAKSTMVRALSALLPLMKRHRGCFFSCDPDNKNEWCDECKTSAHTRSLIHSRVPIVTLPLSATEDRVAGGLDFSLTLKTGKPALLPGLLAKAHRGILYVDEVNLLDDHIVDIILDASASGENRIEREGMSFCHPARFILVGTMNPEEGELRPQLLDRFGLCVDVRAEETPEKRVILMQKREAYDADPEAFGLQFSLKNREISEKIVSAQGLLKTTVFPEHLRVLVAELCTENNVAGHRADLVIEQAAKALAAFKGRRELRVTDIKEVAKFALIHRKRDLSPPPPPDHDHSRDQNREEKTNKDDQQEGQGKAPTKAHAPPQELAEETSGHESEPESEAEKREREKERKESIEKIFEPGETFKVKKFTAPKDRIFRRGSGKRSRSRVSGKQGRYVKSRENRQTGDIAFDATLRAAAPYQLRRRSESTLCVHLKDRDIREKVREKRIADFLLFIVDASGSMGARGRMAASKGAIMSLLLDAYQKRDKVALVTFRKEEAFINLQPTSSIELAAKLLKEMPVGGKTPLSSGLVKGFQLLKNHLLRAPEARPLVIIITDGKGNVSLNGKKPLDEALALASEMARENRANYIVVDSESQGPVSFGLAARLSQALSASYFKIEDLKARQLLDIVTGGMR